MSNLLLHAERARPGTSNSKGGRHFLFLFHTWLFFLSRRWSNYSTCQYIASPLPVSLLTLTYFNNSAHYKGGEEQTSRLSLKISHKGRSLCYVLYVSKLYTQLTMLNENHQSNSLNPVLICKCTYSRHKPDQWPPQRNNFGSCLLREGKKLPNNSPFILSKRADAQLQALWVRGGWRISSVTTGHGWWKRGIKPHNVATNLQWISKLLKSKYNMCGTCICIYTMPAKVSKPLFYSGEPFHT